MCLCSYMWGTTAQHSFPLNIIIKQTQTQPSQSKPNLFIIMTADWSCIYLQMQMMFRLSCLALETCLHVVKLHVNSLLVVSYFLNLSTLYTTRRISCNSADLLKHLLSYFCCVGWMLIDCDTLWSKYHQKNLLVIYYTSSNIEFATW